MASNTSVAVVAQVQSSSSSSYTSTIMTVVVQLASPTSSSTDFAFRTEYNTTPQPTISATDSLITSTGAPLPTAADDTSNTISISSAAWIGIGSAGMAVLLASIIYTILWCRRHRHQVRSRIQAELYHKSQLPTHHRPSATSTITTISSRQSSSNYLVLPKSSNPFKRWYVPPSPPPKDMKWRLAAQSQHEVFPNLGGRRGRAVKGLFELQSDGSEVVDTRRRTFELSGDSLITVKSVELVSPPMPETPGVTKAGVISPQMSRTPIKLPSPALKSAVSMMGISPRGSIPFPLSPGWSQMDDEDGWSARIAELESPR